MSDNIFHSRCVSIITGLLILQVPVLLGQIDQEELRSILTETDQQQRDISVGYKVSFVMTTRATSFDPNQGKCFMDCSFARNDDSFAMKIIYDYEKPPVFVPLNSRRYQPFDYDEQGRLIVWRPVEKYTLLGPDRNEVIEKSNVFYADPDGKTVVLGYDYTILSKFPLASRDSIFQYSLFELTVGRGFAKHLDSITSTKSLSSGLLEINAQGSFGSGLSGHWKLTVDPNANYLVREATFTADGQVEPTIEVTSTGIITKDGLKYAKIGEFISAPDLEISVEADVISKMVAPNELYQLVLGKINANLPPGKSEIVDFRGEVITRTSVK